MVVLPELIALSTDTAPDAALMVVKVPRASSVPTSTSPVAVMRILFSAVALVNVTSTPLTLMLFAPFESVVIRSLAVILPPAVRLTCVPVIFAPVEVMLPPASMSTTPLAVNAPILMSCVASMLIVLVTLIAPVPFTLPSVAFSVRLRPIVPLSSVTLSPSITVLRAELAVPTIASPFSAKISTD